MKAGVPKFYQLLMDFGYDVSDVRFIRHMTKAPWMADLHSNYG
jgi:hypothetical protein